MQIFWKLLVTSIKFLSVDELASTPVLVCGACHIQFLIDLLCFGDNFLLEMQNYLIIMHAFCVICFSATESILGWLNPLEQSFWIN